MNTSTLREAAQQALAALETAACDHDCGDGYYRDPANTLRAALAEPYDQQALELCEECGWKTLIPTEGCLNCERQPKAEPVAWGIVASNTGRICQVELDADEVADHNPARIVPLYAAPQPRHDDEALLRQALHALIGSLENPNWAVAHGDTVAAITAIKERLG
jgi:hypothetical protein